MTDAEADSNELTALFRAEWPKILATLIRSTGSVELAEDAVQEAFARALVARDRALLINPAAWITTVARFFPRVHTEPGTRDAAGARSALRLWNLDGRDRGSPAR